MSISLKIMKFVSNSNVRRTFSRRVLFFFSSFSFSAIARAPI